MFNLLKMDMYRLIRSRTTLIMIIVTATLAVFCMFMTSLSVDIHTQELEADAAGEQITHDGVFFESSLSWTNDSKIDFTELLTLQLQSRLLLAVVAVFTVLFIAAEYKKGFIKNIAGQFPIKGVMAASKLITIATMVLVMLIVFDLSMFLTGVILFKDRLVLGSAAELLQTSGLNYLLHFAYACVFVFLTALTRSSALGITLGILFSGGVSDLLYSCFDYLIPGDKFSIAEYTTTGNISTITANMSNELVTKAVLVGVIFILASSALYTLTVQKKDIN